MSGSKRSPAFSTLRARRPITPLSSVRRRRQTSGGGISRAMPGPTPARSGASAKRPRLTYTNFRRLRQNNAKLNSELRQRRQYSETLEQQLRSSAVVKAKDRNLRKAIHAVSACLFLAAIGFLLHANYVMLSPHFNAIVMALLVSELLRLPCQIFSRWNAELARILRRRARALLAISTLVVALSLGMGSSVVAAAVAVTVISIWALGLLCVLDSRAFTATILTFLVVLVVLLPLYWTLMACAEEAQLITKVALPLLESESDLQTAIERFASSAVYVRAREAAAGMGWEVPETLDAALVRAHVREVASVAGSNLSTFTGSILNFVANVGSVLVSCVTFVTCLYYFFQMDGIGDYLVALSPLAPEDNERLSSVFRTSTMRIFLCSGGVGAAHAITTYVGLAVVCEFDVRVVPSFASGIMAVMPLFGSYVVWIPAALVAWLVHGNGSNALGLVSLELFTRYVVDAAFYDLMGGSGDIIGNSYYIGLSVVCGMYSYGMLGFVWGPLLVSLSICVVSIYRAYLLKPLYRDTFSPLPGEVSPNATPSTPCAEHYGVTFFDSRVDSAENRNAARSNLFTPAPLPNFANTPHETLLATASSRLPLSEVRCDSVHRSPMVEPAQKCRRTGSAAGKENAPFRPENVAARRRLT